MKLTGLRLACLVVTLLVMVSALTRLILVPVSRERGAARPPEGIQLIEFQSRNRGPEARALSTLDPATPERRDEYIRWIRSRGWDTNLVQLRVYDRDLGMSGEPIERYLYTEGEGWTRLPEPPLGTGPRVTPS